MTGKDKKIEKKIGLDKKGRTRKDKTDHEITGQGRRLMTRRPREDKN